MNTVYRPLAIATALMLLPAGAVPWAAALPLAAGWSAAGAPALRGLTAGVVIAALLWALRRGGPRFAGLLAALPVTSAPALFWLSLDYGLEPATVAARAGVYATALSGVLMLAYGHAARRFGPMASLAVGLAAALATGLATLWMAASTLAVAAFAVLALAVALRALPRLHGSAEPTRPWRHGDAVGAVATTVMTTAVLLLAPLLPAQWVGLAAALPLVGMASIVLVHRKVAPPALAAFLRAYVSGLTLKAVFLLVLTVALAPLGVAAAWVLAGAAVVAVVLGASGVGRWWRRAIESADKTGAKLVRAPQQ